VLVLVALAVPAQARADGLTVSLLDAKQRTVLKRNALSVVVHAASAGRVRVSSAYSRARAVRFRHAGTKRVRLRLTRRGRRALARCVARTITVRARGPGRARAFVRTGWQRDRHHCPHTHDGRALTLASSPGGPLVGTSVGFRGPQGGSGKLDSYGSDAMPADRCDPLDPSVCLQPFPNDHFTRADAHSATGRRLDLQTASMPQNSAGKPIDPTDQNRNDGFSPGNLIVTHVPGMDNKPAFDRTGVVPLSDIARYADPDQPVVVVDATTHKRWPIWGEMDVNPAHDSDRNLIVRPAVNFTEGHRYVVALRKARDKSGKLLEPTPAFRFFRDGVATEPRVAALEARRPKMERIFGDLARAGIEREDLSLAWDFTVASEKSLSERVLQMRNDAFAQLGDRDLSDLRPEGRAPQVMLNPDTPDAPINDDSYGNTDAQQEDQDGVENYQPCGDDNPPQCGGGHDYWLARQVRGQIVVPCYLDKPGCPPGSRFSYGSTEDTLPTLQPIPGNTMLAPFTCNIPRAALDTPGRPSLYGHGLLGTGNGEINQTQIKAFGQEHDFVFCATDWAGMSRPDIPNVGTQLADLSNFSSVVDRSQQGFVNQLYLARAMNRPDGLCSLAPFQRPGGGCVIDTSPGRTYYDGNSQGGIFGGALAALEVDADRATIGVPGMNFSTLLRRSKDFAPFAAVLYRAYPSELERPLIISLIQLLWDRGEADGYAEHMTTDPLPDTPAHHVLMHVALGDQQVSDFAADVEARTIGARTLPNPVAPGRLPEVTPLWGIPRIRSFPYDGSAIVYWDSGTPSPPLDEVPPSQGNDPHETPRNQAAARAQKAAFLAPGGKVVDVCGGGPCKAVDKFTTPGPPTR
jgi:hypothetical protein